MRRLVLGAAVLGLLVPLVPLALWAGGSSWPYPDLLPTGPSSRGIAIALRGETLAALLTSVTVSTAVATLSCGIGFGAGRVLGLHRFPGRRLLIGLLVLPVLVPGLAVVLGLQVFVIRSGLADSWLGVVLVQLVLTVPYAVALLAASFAGFDPGLERQARTLGAGPWRTAVHVTVPALAPAVAATFVLTFLISWGDYLLTLLVGGGQVTTLTLLLFSAIGTSDTTASAALGLVVAIPPVLLLLGLVLLARRSRFARPAMMQP
ncbi:ABC transporter, permease protein [Aeromicrobium marinum DSM 15272]|uniref:ABC transporter, permease protein n=1 Tax=Aeromicrobium marinum DSM 15272 TaxID=585531 RepID=E2SEY6_9ACTN|nr:ABC transporter permease subunit [Aeromicrobium marinum]EFQ82230.1 ABC transporter, permease protein [Aeromicrobium marinum DSM 15272]